MSTRSTPGAQSFKACVSDYHKQPVPATVHGSFKSHWNAANNDSDVWYCQTCASAGEAVGLFTRDHINQEDA